MSLGYLVINDWQIALYSAEVGNSIFSNALAAISVIIFNLDDFVRTPLLTTKWVLQENVTGTQEGIQFPLEEVDCMKK